MGDMNTRGLVIMGDVDTRGPVIMGDMNTRGPVIMFNVNTSGPVIEGRCEQGVCNFGSYELSKFCELHRRLSVLLFCVCVCVCRFLFHS